MQERENFIRDWLAGEETFTDLCRRYGIHRSKGYKWRNRYLTEGIAGLIERSRAPHRHPNQTPDELCEALVALRRKHPRWGAVKLLELLRRREPEVRWPAPSTAHEILRRADLVQRPAKPKPRAGHYTSKLTGYYGPNAVWAADFKGHFLTWDKARCNPLTLSDLSSRFLLRCSALPKSDVLLTKQVFDRAFREFGLPLVIRTDNGPPFSSTSGLSALSVWWIQLGIRPERISPGCPTQNGVHERIHKTMDDEYATVRQDNLNQQQKRFDRFRKTYNEVRPHRALGLKTPAELYRRSERSYPKKLQSPQYENGTHVLRVDADGRIRFNGKELYLSKLLAAQPVGLVQLDRYVDIWYGPQFLGTIHKNGQLRRGYPKNRPVLKSPEQRPTNL